MTIAACYVSPEGVVFGADSTSTYASSEGNHYLNHGQKIFEVGENSTLGMVTWGLGGLGYISYRRLIADLSDQLIAHVPASVLDAASQWATLFWPHYAQGPFANDIARCQALSQLAAYDPNSPNAPGSRTETEENEFVALSQALVVGFCIGGHTLPDRTPAAYEIIFGPLLQAQPVPVAIPPNNQKFWGAPNMFCRLLFGADPGLSAAILKTGHWGATPKDLNDVFADFRLDHPILPLRDAIDFTYWCIYSTIKAFKFSSLSQICGGAVELAVISADRRFRWVKHKELDAAI
ncbi:hypothetical protein NKI34_25860 [Mesorhizobium sp. M0700]|uniref:hypothetical protein n=1 Tax=unclassified Mesorhizobium TaxID=325217 RepID=UPI0033387E5F